MNLADINARNKDESNGVTTTISIQIQTKKKELIDLMRARANVSADQVIDVALSEWIRLNLNLLTEAGRQRFGNYFIGS